MPIKFKNFDSVHSLKKRFVRDNLLTHVIGGALIRECRRGRYRPVWSQSDNKQSPVGAYRQRTGTFFGKLLQIADWLENIRAVHRRSLGGVNRKIQLCEFGSWLYIATLAHFLNDRATSGVAYPVGKEGKTGKKTEVCLHPGCQLTVTGRFSAFLNDSRAIAASV